MMAWQTQHSQHRHAATNTRAHSHTHSHTQPHTSTYVNDGKRRILARRDVDIGADEGQHSTQLSVVHFHVLALPQQQRECPQACLADISARATDGNTDATGILVHDLEHRL